MTTSSSNPNPLPPSAPASEEHIDRAPATGSGSGHVLDRKVTVISVGILALFVLASLIFPAKSAEAIDNGFTASARWLGLYW